MPRGEWGLTFLNSRAQIFPALRSMSLLSYNSIFESLNFKVSKRYFLQNLGLVMREFQENYLVDHISKNERVARGLEITPLMCICFIFIYFVWLHPHMWKFPGQGLNPQHSRTQAPAVIALDSLTHGTTLKYVFVFKRQHISGT